MFLTFIPAICQSVLSQSLPSSVTWRLHPSRWSVLEICRGRVDCHYLTLSALIHKKTSAFAGPPLIWILTVVMRSFFRVRFSISLIWSMVRVFLYATSIQQQTLSALLQNASQDPTALTTSQLQLWPSPSAPTLASFLPPLCLCGMFSTQSTKRFPKK